MFNFVFLLGRPDSGKSVIYKLFQEKLKDKGIECERTDDFLTLKEILSEDKEYKRHVLKNGGFAVTDWSVVDEALQRLNIQVKTLSATNKIVFVEFARDNYQHALKNFDNDVLSKSLILYVYCPYEECYRRNIQRFKLSTLNGSTEPFGPSSGRGLAEVSQPSTIHDNHIVPLDLMETYYRTDDYEALATTNPQQLKSICPAEVVVIDSSKPGTDGLKPQIEQIVKNWRLPL